MILTRYIADRFRLLTACLMALSALWSCTDKYLYDPYIIPDGVANLTCQLVCEAPAAAALGGRTPGNEINDFKRLDVLIYDADDNLYRHYSTTATAEYDPETGGTGPFKLENYAYKVDGNKDTAEDAKPSDSDEVPTAHASFDIKRLPFGKYHIYAVANTDFPADFDFADLEKVKKYKLGWNASSIAANGQMFGYFTPFESQKSEGFDAPEIIVRDSSVKIHSWLKRAVSKVTVAFDGSGLKNGVNVYIQNVTIYDIPKTCYLGAENAPNDTTQLLNRPWVGSVRNANTSSLTYSADGQVTAGYRTITNPEQQYESGLWVNKVYKPNTSYHAANAQSLFFFENIQGDKSEEGKNDIYYNKEQQEPYTEDGVGKNINYPYENGDSINDYKDRVPCGTYIEVEAYYISNSFENTSHGPIKYRFMLGKDTRYDYNAQRNYHYKLTLGFRGWANQPDWHIIYNEDDPGIEVGPTVRVSYLYNTPATLPVKLNGTPKSLKLEIVENNWAPIDEDTDVVPSQVVASEPAQFQFKWARNVYNAGWDGVTRPWLGFLALQVKGNSPKDIATDILNTAAYNFDKGLSVQTTLNTDYYKKEGQNERTFSAADLDYGKHEVSGAANNNWEVNHIVDTKGNVSQKSRMVLIPIWTRPKSMIYGSGFSGNNPYEYYSRKAKIKLTGIFEDPSSPTGEKEVIEYCTVYQVPRVVNPKGIWRSLERSENFSVTLMTAVNSNGQSDYRKLVSKGPWRAYIEAPAQTKIGIVKNSATEGYASEKGDTIYGYDGSNVEFDVTFPGSEASAVIHVDYHNNNCVHKILVRQGTASTVELGDGVTWYPYTLYGARWLSDGSVGDGFTDTYTAEFTKHPLVIGSLFRRGKQSLGIRQWNNDRPNLGFMKGPDGASFSCRNYSDGWRNYNRTWDQINYRDDYNNSGNNRQRTLGTFDGQYKVATLDDYQKLTAASEFAFGIFYSDGATKTQRSYSAATGLTDYNNTGTFDGHPEYGARAVVAYNATSGKQVIFPIGGTGAGRRKGNTMHRNNGQYVFLPDTLPDGKNYRWENSYFYGMLQYGDVCELLSASSQADGNWWRPVCYNLPINPGVIYWIDQFVNANNNTSIENNCLGWDINFFNFDFSPYTANNYMDACPIKLVVKK